MTLMERLNDWVRTFGNPASAELATELLELDDPEIAAEQMAEQLSQQIEQADYIVDLLYVPQSEDNYIVSARLWESKNGVDVEIPPKLAPKTLATLEKKNEGDLDAKEIEDIWGTHHLYHVLGDEEAGYGFSFYNIYTMLTKWDDEGRASVGLSRDELIQGCSEIRDYVDEVRPYEGLPGVHAPEF